MAHRDDPNALPPWIPGLGLALLAGVIVLVLRFAPLRDRRAAPPAPPPAARRILDHVARNPGLVERLRARERRLEGARATCADLARLSPAVKTARLLDRSIGLVDRALAGSDPVRRYLRWARRAVKVARKPQTLVLDALELTVDAATTCRDAHARLEDEPGALAAALAELERRPGRPAVFRAARAAIAAERGLAELDEPFDRLLGRIRETERVVREDAASLSPAVEKLVRPVLGLVDRAASPLATFHGELARDRATLRSIVAEATR